MPESIGGSFGVFDEFKNMFRRANPSFDQEDPLKKEMAIHSSILAWKISWMEELDRLQSMGSQRVGHD